jgi:hypothetical protein
MTDTTTNNLADPTSGQRGYDAVLAHTVRVLTEAARRRITRGHGSEQQDQADFADFLADALAGTAANLGGIEQLLAGRSGSWEANYVRQLLVGTVGEDEAYLFEHRTEPLVIRVHADDILNELGFWPLYDDADTELNRREAAILTRHDDGGPIEDYDADDTAALDEIDRLRDTLDSQREQDCAGYARAFTGQVHTAAAELFPGLPVPVDVLLETTWQNDIGVDTWSNSPEWRIWETARRNTPLPGSGIPLRDYPLTLELAQVERDAGRTPLARLDAQAGQS